MTRIRGFVVIAALVLLFVAAGCGGGGGGGDEGEEATTTTIAGAQAEVHGTKDVSGATEKVEVELDDNYFEPTILEGTPGQKLELELKNEGNTTHTFTLTEQSVDAEVQPGDETEVNVTFPQSGELKFVCRFHGGEGMIGALTASSG